MQYVIVNGEVRPATLNERLQLAQELRFHGATPDHPAPASSSREE